MTETDILNSPLENSELAQICREIVGLGDEPSHRHFVVQELTEHNYDLWTEYEQYYEWWIKLLVENPRSGEDLFERYLKDWIWSGVKDEEPPISKSNEFNIKFPYIDRYLGSILECIDQFEEPLSDYSSFYEMFSKIESEYVAKVREWTKNRLELDRCLIGSSPGLIIFHRELVAALNSWDTGGFSTRQRHIMFYWDDVVRAMDKYFQNSQNRSPSALTKSSHADNRKLAKKLKTQVDEVLSNFPWEFAPDYADLAENLGIFLDAPHPKLIPKKEHAKIARQVLIRELIKDWYAWTPKRVLFSPVKHVLNLVSSLDPSITEREIYRELELFKSDTKSTE